MRTIARRIKKLENRFGAGKTGILVVVTSAGWDLALGNDTCASILRKYEFLPLGNSGVNVVNLGLVPRNLNAEELERYLRENGAMICGPQRTTARGR